MNKKYLLDPNQTREIQACNIVIGFKFQKQKFKLLFSVSTSPLIFEQFKICRTVERITAQCSIARRFGHNGDGGWNICLAGPYALKAPCLVYSFGFVWQSLLILALEYFLKLKQILKIYLCKHWMCEMNRSVEQEKMALSHKAESNNFQVTLSFKNTPQVKPSNAQI